MKLSMNNEDGERASLGESQTRNHKMPKVSVIIPTHNRPHLLPRAVQSARQAGTDVEVIVVDDASIDATAEVCQQLAGIKYVRVERNRNVAGARNLGILASTADYISFLDDDDLRLPESLDLQLEALEATPEAGFVYGQMLLGNQDGLATGELHPASCPQGDIFWRLLERNFVPCGSVVFRKSCLLRIGLLDEAIPGVDDWDLWIRMAELYPVVAIEQPMIIWRQSTFDSGQLSSSAPRMMALSAHLFRSRWLGLPRAASADLKQRRAIWHRYHVAGTHYLLGQAARALQERHFKVAFTNALAALKFNPREVARSLVHPATLRFLSSPIRIDALRKTRCP